MTGPVTTVGASTCQPGTPCASSLPCRTGITACDNGKPVCSDAGTAPDGTGCGNGEVCSAGACVPPTCGPGQTCQPPDPCRTGVPSCGAGASLPTCTATGTQPDGTPCGQGQVCTAGTCGPAPVAACVNAPQPSAAPQPQHFGTIRVGQKVSFQVPAGTVSITIVEQAVNAPQTISYRASASAPPFTFDNTAVPLNVDAPPGTSPARVYDDNPATPVTDPTAIAAQPAYFASDSPGTGTLTIPNTTGGLALVGSSGLPAGTWSLTVSDYAYECTFPQAGGASCSGGSSNSTYDVTVITKPRASGADPIQATGSLAVVVYFATTIADTQTGTAAPLSAATANAGGDPDLNRMAQTLKRLLAQAGISTSSITYRDLPSVQASIGTTGINVDETGTCSALGNLLRNSEPGNQLNVFLVSSFDSAQTQGANQVVGIDGTIPGPATFGGTNASGVAVATHDLRARSSGSSCQSNTLDLDCGADVTAYVVAHEAGHTLGLYHVTESDGTSFDPLQQTPTCACSTCAPASSRSQCADATPTPSSPYQMNVSDCTGGSACGGGDNLMFWLLDTGSAGTLTPDQQRVMRANPLVQ